VERNPVAMSSPSHVKVGFDAGHELPGWSEF